MSGAASYVTLEELVGELGHDVTKALLRAFGGQRIYVPADPGPDHALTMALGARNAARLGAMIATGIGGMTIELPTGSESASASARRRLLELAADSTLTEGDIARELRVHARTVRRARAKLRSRAA